MIAPFLARNASACFRNGILKERQINAFGCAEMAA